MARFAGVQIARVRVVRIDLVLVLKLVTLVMVLNQDGSRSRFLMLSAAAVIFYLHQTGVLRPLQDWIMPRIMERASVRRRPPAGECFRVWHFSLPGFLGPAQSLSRDESKICARR